MRTFEEIQAEVDGCCGTPSNHFFKAIVVAYLAELIDRTPAAVTASNSTVSHSVVSDTTYQVAAGKSRIVVTADAAGGYLGIDATGSPLVPGVPYVLDAYSDPVAGTFNRLPALDVTSTAGVNITVIEVS